MKDPDERFPVLDPATGEEIATYPVHDAAFVDEAVKRARREFEQWSKSSFKERSKVLRKAAAILADGAEEYAGRIARENGKTLMDALLADIYSVADSLAYLAKTGPRDLAPVRVAGRPLMPGRKAYYVFEPRGVVGIISPWNYPFTLSAGPAIEAIMAGNAVVLKPSEQTPESGLMVKEILEAAGLPPGVVNIVLGPGGVTGQALVDHSGIDMLFFTGSTRVGRMVNVKAAERLIPAVMELGGKDVAIVTRNADLDRAAHGTMWAAFTNTGQTCIGTEVILVDRAVYGEFVEKASYVAGCLHSGKRSGELGAMTMEAQFDIVSDQLEDALAKGAEILLGKKPDPGQKGRFFGPVLLGNTTAEMKVRTEETFGPLKPVVPYDTIEEAIEIANSTEYGLSGSVYTRNAEEGRRIARRLKTGSVNINDALITYAFPSLPFGGMKESGVGRYHGGMGIRSFTDVKSVTEFWWPQKREPYWYPMPKDADEVAAMTLRAMFSDSIAKRLANGARLAGKVVSVVRREMRDRGGCDYGDYI